MYTFQILTSIFLLIIGTGLMILNIINYLGIQTRKKLEKEDALQERIFPLGGREERIRTEVAQLAASRNRYESNIKSIEKLGRANNPNKTTPSSTEEIHLEYHARELAKIKIQHNFELERDKLDREAKLSMLRIQNEAIEKADVKFIEYNGINHSSKSIQRQSKNFKEKVRNQIPRSSKK